MKNLRLLFTADVHGNKYQTFSALARATELNIDAVVFGGDISPKEGNKEYGSHFCLGHKTRNPKAQREYYEKFMIPLFDRFTRSTKIKIYTMMGNDDFRSNMDILEEAEDQEKLRLLHDKSYELPNGLFITGCSFINLTRFINKDWEKWDLSIQTDNNPQKIKLEGYSSTKNGFYTYCKPEQDFYKVDFRNIPKEDSLEAHLFNKTACLSPPNKTIYVIHAPPYGTNIDQISEEIHAGSYAVRRFFEQKNAILGLHGHIHETVNISGSFKDKIGNTPIATPGNQPFNRIVEDYTNYSKKLYALIVSFSQEGIAIKREKINCN